MREIVLFMVDSWAERAHLGSAPLPKSSVFTKTCKNNNISVRKLISSTIPKTLEITLILFSTIVS